MFSCEFKINGVLVAHIYGHNESWVFGGEPDECEYHYEVHEFNKDGAFVSGKTRHCRRKGIFELVGKICQLYTSSEGSQAAGKQPSQKSSGASTVKQTGSSKQKKATSSTPRSSRRPTPGASQPSTKSVVAGKKTSRSRTPSRSDGNTSRTSKWRKSSGTKSK